MTPLQHLVIGSHVPLLLEIDGLYEGESAAMRRDGEAALEEGGGELCMASFGVCPP